MLAAFDEVLDYDDLRYVRNITQGKADTFPIIGRKRDATEHTPGELILGGDIEHNDVEITLDKMLVDSVFIAEIDELMVHYDLAGPYAKQLGQSLGSVNSKRIAIMHILASRVTDAPYTGGPVPAYFYASDLKTNPKSMEDAAFLCAAYLLENDISGEKPVMMLPHQQHLLLARYSGVQGGVPGSAMAIFDQTGRRTGEAPQTAGFTSQGTNHIPSTNITTGLSKYQGDFADTVGHVSSRMAVGTLERRGLKVVMKQQDDRLGTLMIASQFNGHGKLRNECAIELRTSDLNDGRTALNEA